MTKIHYFQRYSTLENSVTNNTLQLLARIYDHSRFRASELLTELTGQPVTIGLEITQQERGVESVPDGSVIQRSLKILVEAKVDSPVDTVQLMNHAKQFSGESQRILLLLTRQALSASKEAAIADRIFAKYPGVVFKSITYEDICQAITGMFKEYERDICVIVEDYIEYCNEAGLFDQSPYLLRIVPCGDSLRLNRKYGIYFQPSDRGYTKHSYVGIYANKSVQVIWRIDSVFDIEFVDGQLTKTLIEGRQTNEYDQNIVEIIKDAKPECGYNVATGHRFFCGKPEDTEFRKTSSGGIQGARFASLRDHVGELRDVPAIAEQLRTSEWK